MLHALRIILVAVLGMTTVLAPYAFSADVAVGDVPDYQQRCDILAAQLATLQKGGGSRGDALVASRPSAVAADGVDNLSEKKSALVAAALNDLIAGQTRQATKSVNNEPGHTVYLSVSQPAIILPEFNTLPAYQAADDEFLEEMPAAPSVEEAPDVVEAPDADMETVEADEVYEPALPLPPAPRVQATDQVREAQKSLISQLRDLMIVVTDPEDVAVSEMPELYDPLVNAMLYEEPPADISPAPAPVVREARRPLPPPPHFVGDPLDQPVDLDFRDVDLTHVVAILALKADINIIAGAELRGVVTANLRQVPLRVAMDTVLRMNGLGIIEEDGIHFIIPYEEAAAVNRKTAMVTLENAQATDIQRVLNDMIGGIRDEAVINISANRATNVLVISAPPARVDELVAMANQLDVAKPVLPTITEAISLNYAEPRDMMPLIQNMLTDRIGQVAGDNRARHLVVTDMPVVVEQVKDLVKRLDIPTKQVLIEAMVVDAVLNDEADTGVQWVLESVRRMSRRQAALGPDGRAVGNLQELAFLSDLEGLQRPGGLLSFSVLTDRIDWQGLIQMEVRNRNGRLVSNPVLLTVENEPAQISISQEVPYIELTQTAAGGQQTSTRFKEVGTILSVTPRVTHDNTIITSIEAKESTTVGEFQGIPIEDKREIESTMRMGNGQTIFVGGLRKSDGASSVKKIPVLGDIPIVNFMFRTTSRREQINELLVFLTCTVIEAEYPDLTPYQQEVFDTAPPIVPRVDAWETIMHDTRYPLETKEPIFQWRRGT